jgi:CRP/FNR family cyclic AMP-dependent transcriptional regulator
MEADHPLAGWGAKQGKRLFPLGRPFVVRARCLPQTPLFADLTEEERAALDRQSRLLACSKGALLYAPGETGQQLFIVIQGAVELYERSEGRRLLLARLGPGAVFGEMALLGQAMYDAFAEAVEPSLLCVLEREALRHFLLHKPELALRLLELVGQRLLEVEAQLSDLVFKDVAARLASALLRLAARGGDVVEGWTHRELSELIGCLRETVTIQLDVLQAKGLVELGRRRIVLRDRAALEALAARSTPYGLEPCYQRGPGRE